MNRLKERHGNAWAKTPGSDPQGMQTKTWMGELPPEGEWIREAKVRWLGKEGGWHDRRVILSKDALIMTHLDDTHIKDQIPLLEVRSCDMVKNKNGDLDYNSANFESDVDLRRGSSTRNMNLGASLTNMASPESTPSNVNSGARTGSDGEGSIPLNRGNTNPLLRGMSSLANSVAPKSLNARATSTRNVLSSGDASKHGNGESHLVGASQMTDIMLDGVDRSLCFDIVTEPNGYNCGRTYIFHAETNLGALEWVRDVQHAWETALFTASNLGAIGHFRLKVEIFASKGLFQSLMVLFILGNFVLNVVQAELKLVEGTYWAEVLDSIEVTLTILFAIELSINMFALWFWRFWSDGWFVFDFIVVSLSLVAIVLSDVGDFNNLRLLRPLRVVRLLGRLQSLRLIINACTRSLIPVFNAFLVTFLITAIYSIIGVSTFDRIAPEFFNTFSIALFTMFQIATGDAWSSDVARTLLRRKESCTHMVEVDQYSELIECYAGEWERLGTSWASRDSSLGNLSRGTLDTAIILYFASFVILVGLTLLNVVVAVLLDNFTMATEAEKTSMQAKQIQEQAKPLVEHPLDPLLSKLVLHDSTDELTTGISVLFRTFDTSLNSTISREELSEGLRKLKTDSVIDLSDTDYETMTHNLLDADGELTRAAFEAMLRRELSNFIQRHMARQIELSGYHGRQDPTILFALKKLMLGVDERLYTLGSVSASRRAASMHLMGKKGVDIAEAAAEAAPPAAMSGVVDDRLRSLEEQNKLLQDALRLQTGHIESIMRRLDVPVHTGQQKRILRSSNGTTGSPGGRSSHAMAAGGPESGGAPQNGREALLLSRHSSKESGATPQNAKGRDVEDLLSRNNSSDLDIDTLVNSITASSEANDGGWRGDGKQ